MTALEMFTILIDILFLKPYNKITAGVCQEAMRELTA